MWIRRKVQSGQQIGRKIASPTLNFNVGHIEKYCSQGVYGAYLKIKGKNYKGALYFGPKLAGKKPVLEVYVFDFSASIYGQFVSFRFGKKVRDPIFFDDLDALKKQIQQDVSQIHRDLA